MLSVFAVSVLMFSLFAHGEGAAPAEEKTETDRYSMTFDPDGKSMAIELALLDESSAVLTAGYDFTFGYEREGSAVRLSLCEEAKDEKASMWDQLPHDYLLDQEEDLRPYAVQNHAFGGSTDRDLLHWAPYMLYPYQPRIIFSGNYSRTARPLQPRYFPPCAYAANRPCKCLHLKGLPGSCP